MPEPECQIRTFQANNQTVTIGPGSSIPLCGNWKVLFGLRQTDGFLPEGDVGEGWSMG